MAGEEAMGIPTISSVNVDGGFETEECTRRDYQLAVGANLIICAII